MRKENSNFKTCYLSEAGRQLENRDYFAYVEEPDFACWVMASSIDDSETINSAELAVKTVLDSFMIQPAMSRRALANYIKEAHETLLHESVRDHLQCSIMIVVSDYMSLRWASAGNVHLQCMYNSKIRFFSKDQSFYQEMVDQEVFPLDRSLGFEERNNLTCYLGMPEHFKPYISEERKLLEMDTLVLTTVGMWEYVSDIEMIDALHEAKSPQEAINNLEDLLLSRQPKYLGNYSVAIIMINKIFVKNYETWKKVKKALMIAIPIILVLCVALFFYFRSQAKRKEQIQKVIAIEKKADDYVRDENYKRALSEYGKAVKEGNKIKKYTNKPLVIKEKMSEFLVDGKTSEEKNEIEDAQKLFTKAKNYKIDHEKPLNLFNSKYISNQLKYLKDKLYINDLNKLGDTQLEAEQYDEAIKSFQKAKLTAIEISDQSAVKDLNVKIELATSKKELADNAANKAAADKAASEAAQNNEGNDGSAASKYDDIADQYENAGYPEKANQMRAQAEKIRAEEEKTQLSKQEEVAIDLEEKGNKALTQNQYQLAIEFYQGAQLIFQQTGNEARVLQIQRKIDAATNISKETAPVTNQT